MTIATAFTIETSIALAAIIAMWFNYLHDVAIRKQLRHPYPQSWLQKLVRYGMAGTLGALLTPITLIAGVVFVLIALWEWSGQRCWKG